MRQEKTVALRGIENCCLHQCVQNNLTLQGVLGENRVIGCSNSSGKEMHFLICTEQEKKSSFWGLNCDFFYYRKSIAFSCNRHSSERAFFLHGEWKVCINGVNASSERDTVPSAEQTKPSFISLFAEKKR